MFASIKPAQKRTNDALIRLCVYVYFAPRGRASDVFDEDEIKRRREEEKKRIIENLGNMFEKITDRANEKKSNMAELLQMRILKKVVENVAISVQNVHIRYVDTTSFTDGPFALGISLQSITIPHIRANGKHGSTGEDTVSSENTVSSSTRDSAAERTISRTLTLDGLLVYMYMGDAVTNELLYDPSWDQEEFKFAMADIFRVAARTYVVRMLLPLSNSLSHTIEQNEYKCPVIVVFGLCVPKFASPPYLSRFPQAPLEQ